MLAILTTHPIQYQVPLWQALARDGRVPFEVWYLTDHGTRRSFDPGFKRTFAWDLEMLAGYPYRFVPVNENADVSRFRGVRLREPLTGLLKEQGARALWVNGWQVQAYWEAVWQASAIGVEVWLRGESNDLAPLPLWKAPLKRIMLSQLFRRVDNFLCIGSANRRLYQTYAVDDRRLRWAPYAVDNERFAQQAAESHPDRDELRQLWRIPQDAFCVLFAGKFVPKKRPLDVVEAVRRLTKDIDRSKVHLLFAGSGELDEQLQEACDVRYYADGGHANELASDNPAPPASFTGFLNQREISKAYVAADCLVLPSDYGETWGLVVNEALASGLPCLVSDRCGCAADLVDPEWVFRCADVTDLEDKLRALIERSSGRFTPLILGRFDFRETVATVSALAATVRASAGES